MVTFCLAENQTHFVNADIRGACVFLGTYPVCDLFEGGRVTAKFFNF
jgi:hypothetical protein